MSNNTNRSSLTQIEGKTSAYTASPVPVSSSWKSLSVGASHAVAIKNNGTLWAWGSNQYGQVGNGSVITQSSPVQIGSFTWLSASAGANHSMALRSDGLLFGWGLNSNYQLGNNGTPYSNYWKQVVSGLSHTMIIKSDNTLWAVGGNAQGQLGVNTVVATSSPVQVGTSSWSLVSASALSTYAIDITGRLFVWGFNGNSELGLGDIVARSSPVQLGTKLWSTVSGEAGIDTVNTATYAIDSLNNLYSWGVGTNGQLGDNTTVSKNSPILVGTRFAKVAGGNGFGIAVNLDGNLFTWGQNVYGQLGFNDTVSRSVPTQITTSYLWNDVASGIQANFGLTTTGSLFAWGQNISRLGDGTTSDRSAPVQIMTNISKLIINPYAQTGAIDRTGKLWMWGDNIAGALGDGTTISRSAPVQIGNSQWAVVTSTVSGTLGITTDNKLWAWGKDAGFYELYFIATDAGVTQSRSSPVQTGAGLMSDSPVQIGTSSWVSVSAGVDHTMAIRSDKTLWGWGNNSVGQLIAGQFAGQLVSSPTQVGTDTYLSVSAGNSFSLAITTDYKLKASGNNINGQLASPNFSDLYSWSQIAVGSLHTAAIRADGLLFTWGTNGRGQLGDGTTINRSSPVQIGTDRYISVAATDNAGSTMGATLAVRVDGTVWGFGWNEYGMLGQGNTNARSSPVQVGSLSGISKVTAGWNFGFAYNTSGVWTTGGFNQSGQLGTGDTIHRSTPIQISTYNFSQMSAGYSHTAAIRNDGLLFVTGGSSTGELGLNDVIARSVFTQVGTSSWTQIFTRTGGESITTGSTWAIRPDGKLFAWGYNGSYVLGDGTSVNRSSPVQIGSRTWAKVSANVQSAMGIQTDGSLWFWGLKTPAAGSDYATTTYTYSWNQVSAGSQSSYALRNDGTLWGWGLNSTGQVGDNTTVNKSAPVQITTGSPSGLWKDISGGGAFAAGVDSNNNLYTWGKNDVGQLGLNIAVVNRSSPSQIISPLSSFTTVSAGYNHSLAIDTSGKLWSWGSNGFKQLGLTDSVYSYLSWSQVAVGPSHSMFIRSDGRLFGTGINIRGQLGDGTILVKSSPVIIGTETWSKVSVGTKGTVGSAEFTLAIRSDNTLWAWGANDLGQLGNNTTIDRSSPVQIGVGSTWIDIAAGNTNNYAIRSDNMLFTWCGQITAGDNVSTGAPTKFASFSSPVQVSTKPYSKIVTKLSATSGTNGFSLALDTSNNLWAWGANNTGQLGNLTYNSWVSVAITNSISRTMFGIKGDGILYAWGSELNTVAQYNAPLNPAQSSPIVVGQETVDFTKFSSVVGGYSHIYAISTDNKLYGMGVPAFGYSLPDVYSWRQIASTGLSTYAIRNDGMLFAWGRNDSGQLGDSTLTYRSNPVQIGFSSWSQLATPTGDQVSSIAAITSDGRLFAWGANTQGQLGDNTVGNKNSPVQVGVGYVWKSAVVGLRNSFYVRDDGTLFGVGLNTAGILAGAGTAVAAYRSSPVQISSMKFKSVVMADIFATPTPTALAIGVDDYLYTWGSGANGRTGLGTTIDRSSPTQVGTSKWLAVATANNTVAAIDISNRLFSWGGDATYYTLGSSSKAWKTIYNAGSTTFGVEISGKLWGWGGANGGFGLGDGTTTTKSSPVQIGTNTNWTNISSSGEYSLATTSNGGLWSWGRNAFGNLGDGTTINKSSPVQISSASFPVIVAGSYMASAAIDSLNQLFTWGSNSGVLGDGTTINRSQPVQIAGSWADVSVGNSVMFAIRADRTLWTWGANTSGQLGLNDSINRSSPVQIGTSSWLMVSAGFKNFVAAIDINNRLFLWGANVEGEMGDNTTIARSSPVQVSAGTGGAIVLTGSGSSVATSTINFGAGLFTVEGWFYCPSVFGSNTSYWGSSNGVGVTNKIIFNQMNTGQLRVYQSTGEASMTTSTTLVPQNTWVHIAVVRDAVAPAVIKIYVNGVQQPLSVANASTDYSSITGTFNIGHDGEGSYTGFSGYISNFRVVTGIAVYTGNFTVPATVLTPVQAAGTNISAISDTQTQLLVYASTTSDESFYNRSLTLSNASTSYTGPFGYKWTQVVANNGSVVARRIDNTFWVWGSNTTGELGLSDAIARSSPVQLSAFSRDSILLNNITIQPVNSGSTTNTVLYNNGSGLIWGYNGAGAMGDNTTVNKSSPVQLTADPIRSSPVQVGTDYWKNIAGGKYHFIGQSTSGKLFTWGFNGQGQLGTGDTATRGAPTLIDNTSYSVVQLAAGVSSTYVTRSDKIYGWGGNSQGELGDTTTVNRSSPAQLANNSLYPLQQFFNGSSYTQVASYSHTMAIKSDGTLWMWGRNNAGQIGDGTTLDRSLPVQIAGSWSQVEVGLYTSVALKTDGTLWAWGDNSSGQLGVSATNNRSAPMQVAGSWTKIAATGYTTYAINTLGKLYAWGNNASYGLLGDSTVVSSSSPVQIAGSWTQIAAMGPYTFGVKTDNTLFSWGDNSSGQLGLGDVISRSSPVQVASASTGTFILPKSNANWNISLGNGNNAAAFIKDNNLYTIGNNVQGQLGTGGGTASSPVQVGTAIATFIPSPVQVGAGTTWNKISAGADHAAAITSDYRLFTWGGNGSGQLGGGGGEYLSISTNANSSTNASGANSGFTGYVRGDGSLFMAGYNGFGQLGDTTTANKSSPVQIGTTGYWKQVTVGRDFTLAIDYLSRLWSWGNNTWASLGTNNTTLYSSPVLISTSNSWVQVSASGRNGYAIDTSGRLWSWGNNQYGQLGIGTTVTKSSPVQVGTDTNWKAVYTGPWSVHVHAIKNDNTLWAWGLNTSGRLGDGFNSNKSSPVQVAGSWTMVSHNGDYYSEGWTSLGVKTDGTLYAWGQGFGINPSQRTASGVTSWLAVYGCLYGAFMLSSNLQMYYINDYSVYPNAYFDWSGTTTGTITQPVLLSSIATFKDTVNWQNFRLGQVWPTPDNRLYAWGDNSIGLLGQNDTISRSSPVQLGTNISAFSPTQIVTGSWSQVNASHSSTSAINSDSTLYVWGLNDSGQLGTNDTINRLSPVQLPVGSAYINAVQYSTTSTYNKIAYNAAFLLGSGSFTIEAWVYPTTTGTKRGIVNNWQVGGEFYFHITTGNKLLFGYTNAASGISTPQYTGTININANVWTHIALVRNASSWNFYVNGVADTTYTSTDTLYYYDGTAKDLVIGRDVDGANSFVGKIAGLRIVKGVAVYTGNFTVPTTPLAATQTAGTNIAAITGTQTLLLTNQLSVFSDISTNNWVVQSFGPPTIVSASEIYTGLGITPTYSWSMLGSGSGQVNSVIRQDGTLWSTGLATSGQLGDNTVVTKSSFVSVGSTTVSFNAALTSVDNNSYTVATAGYGQSLAIRNDGTLWGWGLNSMNQLGFGTGEVWAQTIGGTFQAGALTSLGRLYTWGSNTWGSVGDGTTTARTTPWLVPNSISWTQMSCAGDSTIAIKTDGTLWAWGGNYSGQLGLGDTISRSSPVQLGSATNWTKVSVNKGYAMALNSLGQLFAWGANTGSTSTGSLGDGTTIDRSSPVQVAGSWSILGMYDAAGSLSATSYAIKPDGTMWAWGNNTNGQFGDRTTISRSQPVQIGLGYSWLMVGCTSAGTLALRQDKTIWSWGAGTYGSLGDGTTIARSSPVQIGATTNGLNYKWKTIAVGTSCAAAIREDNNSLWTWGYNLNGALGDGTVVNRSSPVQVGLSQWTAVSGLGFGFHGITIDNTMFGWGGNYTGSATTSSSSPVSVDAGSSLIASFTSVISPTQVNGSWNKVSTGYHHTLAIKNDGTLWAWGSNSEGQMGTLAFASPLSISASSYVNQDNTLYTWGLNSSGQIGDNTVVSRSSPVQVLAPVSWRQISDSYDGSSPTGNEAGRLGIDSNGDLYAWGKNTYGEIGDKTVVSKSVPVKVGARSWVYISTPYAIKEDGSLWAWGNNAQGQLGDGTTVNKSSPIQIGASSWVAVAAGKAIRLDGTLWGWGYNANGQIGDNTTVSKSSPVQIGLLSNWTTLPSTIQFAINYYSFFAINNLGQLFGWGQNALGVLGDNSTVSRSSPVQIGTGTSFVSVTSGGHALALASTGAMYAWGYNGYGQLGLGDRSHRSAPVQVATGTSWSMISSNASTSFAIKPDGTLWSWGMNLAGILGQNTASTAHRSVVTQVGSDTNWTGIFAFTTNVLATKGSELYFWGAAGPGAGGYPDGVDAASKSSPVQLATPYTFKNISSADYFAIDGITTDGRLIALYGDGNSGYQGDGTTVARSVAVQLGAGTYTKVMSLVASSAVIDEFAQLWMWGSNTGGQLGDSTTVNRSAPVQISGSWSVVAGNSQAANGWVAGIKTDGTLWTWGYNYAGNFGDNTPWLAYRSSPVQVGTSSWTTVVASGVGTMLAVDINGRLFGWGQGAYGQLGQTDVVSRSSPVQIMSGRSFTQVAATYYSSHALEVNGSLWSIGVNTEGYLGDNTLISKSSPVQVGASSWAFITATGVHALGAIVNSNNITTLYAWGNNAQGQLGDGTIVNKSSPTQIGSLYTANKIRYSSPVQIGLGYSWTNVATGPYASIASRLDGSVWTWGMNLVGELGQLDTKYRSSPVQVPSTATGSVAALTDPKQISMNGDPLSGADTTMYIQGRDGLMYGVGYNLYGQVGVTSTVQRSEPAQIASGTMGAAPVFPLNITSTRGSSFTNIGLGSAVAVLSTDNRLWTWGYSSNGILGYTPNAVNTSLQMTVGSNMQSYKIAEGFVGLSSWSQVSAGYNHALAIDSTSRLFAWGNYAASNPIITSNMSWKSLNLDATSIGIRSDGTLWTWGYNGSGELAQGDTINRSSPVQVGTYSWKQVSLAPNNVAAIRDDNTLWTWGYNVYGQLGLNDRNNRSSPVQIAGSWTTVSMSLSNTSAINVNGSLWVWGDNAAGTIGDGTTVSRSSPVQIGPTGIWKKVSMGYNSAALDVDGNLFTWGLNNAGQLGLNDIVSRSSPVQVGLSKWTTIAAGYSYMMAIRDDSTIWTWGNNAQGQLGLNDTVNRSSPVQVGTSLWTNVATGPFISSSFGTDIAGKLYAWGINTYGTIGNNTTAHSSSPVLVNASFTWLSGQQAGFGATASDNLGLLYAWGYNNYYTYGNYTNTAVSSPVLIVNNTISPNTNSPIQVMSGSWNHINAGNDFSIIVNDNNTIYTWGRNDSLQTGVNGTNRYVTSPVIIGTQSVDTGAGNTNGGMIVIAGSGNSTPNAPTGVIATATGPTTATVQYTAPPNFGAVITSYTATSSPGGITGTLEQSASGTISITGLTSGVSYTFTVTATNDVGTGSPSAPSNSVTAWTTPSVPVLGTAVAISNGIAIPITAPNDGGTAITKYVATSSPGGIVNNLYQAGSGTLTATGLSPATSYSFQVHATNIIGDSADVTTNTVTTNNIPGAPTIGTATPISSTATNVTFTAPASDGGTTITRYTAVSTPGGITGYINQSNSGTITVTGLSNSNTQYTFVVYATNGMGNSANSSASNETYALGEQLFNTPGTFSWTAPSGVSSVSVVAIGPGGGGGDSAGAGGGGGGLAYTNNYSVTPGNSYSINVGSPGTNTWFVNSSTLYAETGQTGTTRSFGQTSGGGGGAAGYSGDGGYGGNAQGAVVGYIAGGAGGSYGGTAATGGATGGLGGRGSTSNVTVLAASSGSGGGGGGGQGGFGRGYGGGGTGIYGEGANGAGAPAITTVTTGATVPGGGGSGGADGIARNGGVYGGGGGGGASGGGGGVGIGSPGAVRIIWPGNLRQFPSTRTGNE